MPPYLPLLVGGCCALCAALPCWLWARKEAEVERLRVENGNLRRDAVQAYRTIQSLNKQLGNTETQVMPLSVSQKLGEMFGRK